MQHDRAVDALQEALAGGVVFGDDHSVLAGRSARSADGRITPSTTRAR